jgi:hypothetical protein
MNESRKSPRLAPRSLITGPATPRLVLQHPVFATFDQPFFRISEVERRPVLVIRMDDREASLPLSAVMREFGIGPDDADGVMLDLVARALVFVTGLRIGDRLPPEILSGEASWSVTEICQDRALSRLKLLLVAWIASTTPGFPKQGGKAGDMREMLSRAGQLKLTPQTTEAGLKRLSTEIGGVTPDEIPHRIHVVAEEFAHIEALRDQLLRGAQSLLAVLERLGRNFRGDGIHKELLMQVRRLATSGVADLQERFDDADLLVAEIKPIVSRPDEITAALRERRDALYVRLRAWEPYIMEWATIEAGTNPRTWNLAHDTYRFLAPRFMTMVEWMSAPDAKAAAPARPSMVW